MVGDRTVLAMNTAYTEFLVFTSVYFTMEQISKTFRIVTDAVYTFKFTGNVRTTKRHNVAIIQHSLQRIKPTTDCRLLLFPLVA